MAKFVLKTLPGIDRPAIASIWPTRRGESWCSTSAPTSTATPSNLVEFAVMGEVFARAMLGLTEPTRRRC